MVLKNIYILQTSERATCKYKSRYVCTWRTVKSSVLSASSTRRWSVIQPHCSNFWMCFTEPSWVHSASTSTWSKFQYRMMIQNVKFERKKRKKKWGTEQKYEMTNRYYNKPCHSQIAKFHGRLLFCTHRVCSNQPPQNFVHKI